MFWVHSNACKFTPAGGKLVITTKLIGTNPTQHYPHSQNPPTYHPQPRGSEVPSKPHSSKDGKSYSHHSSHPTHSPTIGYDEKTGMPLSASSLNQHNLRHSSCSPVDTIAVRIEITDTGFGIRQKDLVKGKLFCECIVFTLHHRYLS